MSKGRKPSEPDVIAGVFVWYKIWHGQPGAWWTTGPGWSFLWGGGKLWSLGGSQDEANAVLMDAIPEMGLREAVGFTVGVTWKDKGIDPLVN